MPEYLTPGVYLEETSFRSRSIEGVATSTFGMAGMTRYGPMPYVATATGSVEVAMTPAPVLVTSFTEFQRAFGGLGDVGSGEDTRNYLAYAARAFFGNGGRRLYVSRVFAFTRDPNTNAIIVDQNFAALPVMAGATRVGTWRARWPGAAGQEISVSVDFERSKNVLIAARAPAGGGAAPPPRLVGVGPGAAVEVFPSAGAIPTDPKVKPGTVRIVAADPVTKVLGYRNAAGNGTDPAGTGGAAASHITLRVRVRWGDRLDVSTGLELDPSHPRSIHRVLQAVDPTDDLGLVWFDPSTPPAARGTRRGAPLPTRCWPACSGRPRRRSSPAGRSSR